MLRGGCQCGACRYEVDAEPVDLYVCHCNECRKQSASAFGISVIVPAEALRLLSGELRVWRRPTESGNALACNFCAMCGTRLWHAPEPATDTLSIKGGSLDVPPDLSAAHHIWVASKIPGLELPKGARVAQKEPQ